MTGQLSVNTEELIHALQGKIGQYEVEKIAADLFIQKQNAYVADLENQLLRQAQAPVPTAE